MRMSHILLKLFTLFIVQGVLWSQVHKVEMLNNGSRGVMAFHPSVVHVSVGDQVKFVPTQMGGHNTQSLLIPDSAQAWKGGSDQEVTVNIEHPGVYFYICAPHLAMGMVGFIVADKDLSNFSAVKDKVNEISKTWVMNKERVKEDLVTIEGA